MNKPITTYDDLVLYEQQLKELLAVQKQVIRYDIEEIKGELSPLTRVVHTASKFFTRSKDHSMLVNGISILTGLIFKKIIVPKTGRIGRIVFPFLAKNISSHLVAENKNGLLDKLASIIAKNK